MNAVFADTFYFLALLNANDEAHEQAVAFSCRASVSILTTAWILTELADGLATTSGRLVVGALVQELERDPNVEIVPADADLWRRGLALYLDRADKGWSLTDCISFVVMQDRGIREALTADHHFDQAGFRTLLK